MGYKAYFRLMTVLQTTKSDKVTKYVPEDTIMTYVTFEVLNSTILLEYKTMCSVIFLNQLKSL